MLVTRPIAHNIADAGRCRTRNGKGRNEEQQAHEQNAVERIAGSCCAHDGRHGHGCGIAALFCGALCLQRGLHGIGGLAIAKVGRIENIHRTGHTQAQHNQHRNERHKVHHVQTDQSRETDTQGFPEKLPAVARQIIRSQVSLSGLAIIVVVHQLLEHNVSSIQSIPGNGMRHPLMTIFSVKVTVP